MRVKAKPRTDIRKRKRSRSRRKRTHEPRSRTTMRRTAEQNATFRNSTCRNVGIEVITKICGRTRTDFKRHDFAILTKNHLLHIPLFSWQVATQFIVGCAGTCECRRVVTNVKFRKSAIGFTLNKTFATIRPLPYMPKRVFYTTVRRHLHNRACHGREIGCVCQCRSCRCICFASV